MTLHLCMLSRGPVVPACPCPRNFLEPGTFHANQESPELPGHPGAEL